MQGACGTCPSSAGTMKMGIERALKARPWHAPASKHLAICKDLPALYASIGRWQCVILQQLPEAAVSALIASGSLVTAAATPAGVRRERRRRRARAQAAFGDALTGVEQVEAVSTSATAAAVDAHLDMLRPAITSYGGTVQARASQQQQALLVQ